MSTRYRSNAPRFVDETLDGEALIMDMVKGAYYSCVGASALVWNTLKDGADVDETTALLVATYGISRSAAAADVEQFVASLLAGDLLAERGDGSNPAAGVPTTDAAPVGPYVTLALETYTDLADLILLDPVHDVTEAGWPHKPA